MTTRYSVLTDYTDLHAESGVNDVLPAIETWPNQYEGREYTVEISCPEFTCVCPKTGLPDFATLELTYVPDKRCLELKSFKLYLLEYRGLGIFNEHVVNKVLDDVVAAARPVRAQLEGRFTARGGITTTVRASYRR